MGAFDKIVAAVSPRRACEREAWRQQLEILRGYDAAGYGRLNAGWRVHNESAEVTDRFSRDVVRARARDLERNSDIAQSILHAYKRNVVGKGYTLIKSFEYVLLMTLAQLPGYFTAAWLIERAGRKFVLVVYLTGTAASAWGFGNADTQGALLLYGALLSFFNLGAWGALYAYSPENYPAPIRASGVGTAAGVGRVGGILGPLAIPFLGAQGWSTGAIFVLFAITIGIGAAAVALLGRETRGDLAVQ